MLVYFQCSNEATLHTELALELVECIQQEDGNPVQHEGPTSTTSHGFRRHKTPDEASKEEASLSMLEEYLTWEDERRHVSGGTLTAGDSSHTWLIGRAGLEVSIRKEEQSDATTETCSTSAPIAIPVPRLLSAVLRPSSGQEVSRALRLHTALLLHLHRSRLYDAGVALSALGPLPPSSPANVSSASSPATVSHATLPGSSGRADELSGSGQDLCQDLCLRERILLLSRVGDHTGALGILALYMGDVSGCISYCHRQRAQQGSRGTGMSNMTQGANPLRTSSEECWIALLELLLR